MNEMYWANRKRIRRSGEIRRKNEKKKNIKFDILSDEDRIQSIANIMDNDYSSVAVTLDTGEIIFGDIHHSVSHEYFKYTKTKNKDFLHEKPISDEIILLFPNGKGNIFGHSYGVWIPTKRISAIGGVKSFAESPQGFLRNLPNPFSARIMEHNIEIIARNNYKNRDYMERALVKPASIKQISFQGYELIYADWDYLRTISGGINNIGLSFPFVGGGSVGWKKSLKKVLMDKIKDKNVIFLKALSGKLPYDTEAKIKGYLRVDGSVQDTEFEGIKWDVYYIEIVDKNSKNQYLPLLLSKEKLSYPLEFLHLINSELIFYGELRQIPIALSFQKFDYCLQARAIVYLP